MRGLLASSFMFLVFTNCKENNNVFSDNPIYYHAGTFLVKETHYTSGKIKTKQYFNRDTVHNGPLITYYLNGKILSWKCYFYNDSLPKCKFTFDSTGKFVELKGFVITDSVYGKKNIGLVIMHPPGLKMGIRVVSKYSNGQTHHDTFWDPDISENTIDANNDTTDNMTVFCIDKYIKGHVYKAYVYLNDSVNKQFNCLDSIQLINFADTSHAQNINHR